MSLINKQIKPFKAEAFKDGAFVTVSDEDIKGKWAIFFFYPADFTFVCPTELGDLADHYEELQGLGVEVFSVSTDTHFTHKAWHSSSETIGKIKYAMIGDPTRARMLAALMSLLYFCHAVVELMGTPAQPQAVAVQLVLSVLLFLGGVLYARWRSEELAAAKTEQASSGA